MAENVTGSSADGSPDPARSGRILVVDDQKATLDGLRMFFKRAGKFVVACSTFESARQALLSSSFDVLVTDVRLGAYNGLQLAVLAREQNPAIQIIVFSGVDDPVIRHEATNLSATYVLKPVRGQELLDLIESEARPMSPTWWEQLETAAPRCPILQQAVRSVAAGKATREEALIAAALTLSAERATLLAERNEQRQHAEAALEAIQRIRLPPAPLHGVVPSDS